VVDGLKSRDIGQELAESTLGETGTAAGDTSSEVVSARSVVDPRSPVLKERTATAVSE